MANHQKIWYFSLRIQSIRSKAWYLSFPFEGGGKEYIGVRKILLDDCSSQEKDRYVRYKKKLLETIHDATFDFKPVSVFPDMLYTESPPGKNFKMPDLCMVCDSFLIMTEAFVAVLRRFNLGKTQISPIRFYDLKSESYVNDETYYFLNIAERHQYFLPDLSTPPRKSEYKINGIDVYEPPLEKQGDHQYANSTYAYSAEALSCPVDLWHDPSLRDSLFMSDRLATALREAGFGRLLALWPCRLIDSTSAAS